MEYVAGIGRYGRTGKYELSIGITFVDFITHGIPELRRYLPFVDQARRFTLQQSGYVGLCHYQILSAGIRIRHIKHALGMLACQSGLTTIFRTLYQHASHRIELVLEDLIGNSWPIILHT